MSSSLAPEVKTVDVVVTSLPLHDSSTGASLRSFVLLNNVLPGVLPYNRRKNTVENRLLRFRWTIRPTGNTSSTAADLFSNVIKFAIIYDYGCHGLNNRTTPSTNTGQFPAGLVIGDIYKSVFGASTETGPMADYNVDNRMRFERLYEKEMVLPTYDVSGTTYSWIGPYADYSNDGSGDITIDLSGRLTSYHFDQGSGNTGKTGFIDDMETGACYLIAWASVPPANVRYNLDISARFYFVDQ